MAKRGDQVLQPLGAGRHGVGGDDGDELAARDPDARVKRVPEGEIFGFDFDQAVCLSPRDLARAVVGAGIDDDSLEILVRLATQRFEQTGKVKRFVEGPNDDRDLGRASVSGHQDFCGAWST